MAQGDRELSPNVRRLGARHMVECPGCEHVGSAPELLSDWDGKTYRFGCCGRRDHLGEGGARNWLEKTRRRVG